jgi:ribosomal protein L30/L7E
MRRLLAPLLRLLSCAQYSTQPEGIPPQPDNLLASGPYRRVGNVIIVTAMDHPFKHSWEVNKMLRDLRLEFKGQTVIVPDTPEYRLRLWRTRNCVKIEMIDLDEAKRMIGVPEHIRFTDLQRQLPRRFGRLPGVPFPYLRSRLHFLHYRRMRMRDILHRDSVELRLLEEKKRLMGKIDKNKS